MAWYVIPIVAVFLIVMLLLDIRLLFYYEHPDDTKYTPGLVAKVTAVVGLELVWVLLVIVPTDAFTSRSGLPLDIYLFWKIAFTFSFIHIFFCIPLATKFYEADTDPLLSKRPPWCQAFQYAIIVFVVASGAYLASYFALRNSYARICGTNTNVGTKDYGLVTCRYISIRTPFIMFSAIFVGFIGWILNTIYLGVGLVVMPQGLIVGFIDRPKPITQQVHKYAFIIIGWW